MSLFTPYPAVKPGRCILCARSSGAQIAGAADVQYALRAVGEDVEIVTARGHWRPATHRFALHCARDKSKTGHRARDKVRPASPCLTRRLSRAPRTPW